MLSYDSSGSVERQKPTSAASPLAPSVQAAAPGACIASTTTPAGDVAPVTSQARGHAHIWLITGPAGCGKTTVAEHLERELGLHYIEGDLHHSDANVTKMKNGIPLTDADRWDWLTTLRQESMKKIDDGCNGVVLTCSALKRKYRDVIRVAAYYDHRLLIHFIYLDAPEELLLQRVGERKGHYMGADMVQSQLGILEEPFPDEKDIVTIDVSRSMEEVQQDALDRVKEIMASGGGGDQ